MQARINICDDVINSVPNHEQSVLKGTSMAYHLVDIPADLVKPFVADLLYIENYELKGAA